MARPRLTELRLTSFKSFVSTRLPIDGLTVLTGRNSSGKSNALDGLEVLSRLATGEELADALDGRRREGGQVRGGSEGCAPHGRRQFTLGCTVRFKDALYRLDVTVQVRPELRILKETLWGPAPALESGHVEDRWLLFTRPSSESNTGLIAEIHNGRRGNNPITTFRDNRLLTSQLVARLTVENEADQAVVTASEVVSAALRGVFHLDPIPHLMRSYVPQRDSDLRRTGENLSAAVARPRRRDRATFHEIVSLLRQVADERIQDIEITRSDFGDVMLGLREGPKEVTPAREMSDGLLRFIAVATALLTSNQGLDIDPGVGSLETEVDPGVLVVIEEIENGLHPSQAGQILRLINETVAALDTQVLVTTHSPALLNEMPGEQLTSVLVCYRDHRGRSAIDRLPNLPGYERAMAAGALGDVVTRGELIAPEQAEPEYQGLRQLLGLE